MTDELTAAYEAIPGYAERARALKNITDRRTALRRTSLGADPNRLPLGEARQQITHQIIALAAQQELPDDLAGHPWGPAWRDSMRIAENQNLDNILGEAVTRADNDLRQHIERNSGPALRHLHTRLQKTLIQARHDNLLDDATRAYTAIRNAQKTITIGVLNPGPPEFHGNIRPTLDMLRTAGEIADQFEQWPRWTSQGKPGAPNYDEVPPWPTGPDINRIDYTPDYVRWAARTTARLWVPTIPQLRAAVARHQQLTDARLLHEQGVRAGHLPGERFQIPQHLQADTVLDTKEPANV